MANRQASNVKSRPDTTRWYQNPALRTAFRQLAISLVATIVAGGLLTWTAGIAEAQQLNLDFGEGGSSTSRIIQLLALLTVISLAPSILVMMTSFTRIVVVLSFLRNAMGAQQTPPNNVLISLALFLTLFIMAPTFEAAYQAGIVPLINQEISEAEAFQRTMVPMKQFMLANTRDQDISLFLDIGQVEPPENSVDTPLQVVIPAFMISELRRAFEIGFLLFLPFLVIDMAVASVLMSMGMMMLPPIMVSLPFKIIFFVLVDGWYLVAGSLVQSFNQPVLGGG
ncbi:MAG: flagellar type III secretion system pore protein FliP [Alphaproteobacteria bacterium]|nr:flagellar type III secretion system pore protein FliP [Alphaproteobacteria bacterium SS10]